MKFKYYLRGLGMGIAVTAAILSLSHKAQMKKAVMTEEEIITEAESLGMVMKTEEEEGTPSPSDKEEEPLASKEPESSSEPLESTAPKSGKDKNVKKEETYVEITIVKGMWSDAVSEALENAGLVEDGGDFNDFLSDNGYASFISVGTYEIKMGASYSEIAKIITRQD